MAFPTLTPSKRNFNPGDFPIKVYRSQSGSETRMLMGSKRTGMRLSLVYSNITDAQAETFLDDYAAQNGTYKAFDINSSVKTGWDGNSDALDSSDQWRYESAPVVTQVQKGISNVQVNLVGVL